MLYWSFFLLLLIPFVSFLQPGFIAMATLSIIPEESSTGHVEGIDDDDETQVVPETQFDDDHGDHLDFDDNDSDDRPDTRGRDSMTPRTKKVFEESIPLPSHGSALAAKDRTFQLTRPKSSGEDSITGGFSYAKHQIPKMSFHHGKRGQLPAPEAEKQREPREYREEKLQTIKVPTKPSHIQQEGQAPSVTDHPGHPTLHQTQNGPTDRQPAKKSSKTKSNGKRSKEKLRVPRRTRPAIQQYENPLHVSVSQGVGNSIQLHENPIQICDASVNQNAAWPKDQEAPQQDNVLQSVEQQFLQQQHRPHESIQLNEETQWQQQGEERLDGDHWQEPQNAIRPVDECQWQQQSEAQLDEHHWQEQQGIVQAAHEQSWQHQAEVHAPDEHQWQEQQMQSIPADDEQDRQQENLLRSNGETTLHQSSMVETLHNADTLHGDIQLPSRSAQLQHSDFQEVNGHVISEQNAVDNNLRPVQHISNPTIHDNIVQPMTIATGIKGVTKKKKKKKKKIKVKPALDVRTLPDVPFDIPFEQFAEGHSAENLRRDWQDQQPGPAIPQPSVYNSVHDEADQGSRVTPEVSDQHDLRPAVEAIEEAMDLDQQGQEQENQLAPTLALDNKSAKIPSATRSSANEQTSHRHQSNGASSCQKLHQAATPLGERTGHEVHVHQECDADGRDRGPQLDANHRPQAELALGNDQAAQEASAQELHSHTDDGLDHQRYPQYRAPRHAQPEEPFDVNEPVLQDIDPKQNRLGQDNESINRHRSGKHQKLHQAGLEELPETDEHILQNLHVQQNLRERVTEGSEHRSVETSQHHAPHRPQPLLACESMSLPHHFITPPHGCAQQPKKKPEHEERMQSHFEPSQSFQPGLVVINPQTATHRQGAPTAISQIKSNPRRSSRQQIVAPIAHPTSPVIDLPITTQDTTAAKETQHDLATEACSTQDDPVSGALKILQFTLRQDLQVTIAKENEARRTLKSEIAELKVSEARLQAEVNIVTASKNELIEKSNKDREKLKANSEKLTKLQKFIGGINNDLAKEKQNAKALHQQITELVIEGKASATDRKQIHKQLTKAIETSRSVQRNWAKELTGAKLLIQKFEFEKTSLEKDLQEKNRLLEEERDQRLRLADDVRFQAVDQQLMKQLINDTSASLLQKLSEFQLTVTNSKDTVTSQGVAELLQSVKALESRNPVCPADLTGLKEHIDAFQHRMIDRMSELKVSCNSDSPGIAINAKVTLDLERRLTEQLATFKADVLSTQSLQTQLGELRETKATIEERCGAKDRHINDLNEQLGRLQEAKTALLEKLNQAEAQLCEHTSGPSDEEFESTKQELEEAQSKLKTAGETETTLRTEIETLQESIQAKEGQINAITKQKLESERKAAETFTSMRSQLSREAKQLRQEQQAEFDNEIHQMTQKYQQAVAAQQKAESSSAGHASATESTNKDHAAALDALKKDHESAIENMRKSNTVAMESQSRRLQEEARRKLDAQRRDLNEKVGREKDELHSRIAAAETDKDSALRSLEKAKQEAEEIIKKQTEKARSDLNDFQSRLRAEAQQESDRLTQSHSREQEILRQRATQAEAELESLRNTLKDQLAKPFQPSQISQLSQPARPSQREFQPTTSSSEPTGTPFKKPRRKVDRRDLARTDSRILSDDGVSLHNATPATSKTQWPKIRTFAEIDSIISEGFQIFEDPNTSSELTDLPSSLPSDPVVLRELPVTDPRSNAHLGTASSNGSVSNPFFGPARPRSREHAPANSAMRVTGGPNQANSAIAASRVTDTQHRSPSALDGLPSEIEDSQSQSRRIAFAPGKENRPPVNGAPMPGKSATRSAHFQTPKPKDKRVTDGPTQSSSPDYLSLSQPRQSQKITTYGHNKQANHLSPDHDSQHASRNEPSSSVKRRRSTNAVEDMAPKKRAKTTKEKPVLHFEIPDVSPRHDINAPKPIASILEPYHVLQPRKSLKIVCFLCPVPRPDLALSHGRLQQSMYLSLELAHLVLREQVPLRQPPIGAKVALFLDAVLLLDMTFGLAKSWIDEQALRPGRAESFFAILLSDLISLFDILCPSLLWSG
ncbi:hypothetical protein BLS_002964 [Venturia inaequalis]|uniref:Uncharacterized protein n=1 Tax=Venturia inaequalis TaxID=5025 RepID=A0A8H3UQ29_VENIN|nr:hypothetical protein BLS_002964 [Venturia inaequalis]